MVIPRIVVLAAFLTAGCTTTRSVPCAIDESRIPDIRAAVRTHLQAEFEDSYIYYTNDDSVGNSVFGLAGDANTCTILVGPSPVCTETRGCILHGEYVVYFDIRSLDVTEMRYVAY